MVVLTFSEPVTLTAGMFFVLTPSVSGPVLEIDAGDATQVALSAGDTVVTITPTAGLSAAVSGQAYRLEMATGVVRDTDVPSNAFAGLFSAMYTFTVADVAAPVLVAQVPAAGATGVSKAANIVLTFNEPMAAGTGDIVLTPAAVGGTAVTLAANGARVTVSGTTVTIDPAADLEPTQTTETYTVTAAAGALTDAAGNAWAGLSGSAYTFVLADSTAPAVASYAPAAGATDVAVGTAIVLTFSEAVLAGSGVVVLQSTAGGVSKTLAINDATQVTVSGTTVTLQPAGWLSTGLSTASYTVVMAAGVVTDASAARNAFAGLTAYAFTTSNLFFTKV